MMKFTLKIFFGVSIFVHGVVLGKTQIAKPCPGPQLFELQIKLNYNVERLSIRDCGMTGDRPLIQLETSKLIKQNSLTEDEYKNLLADIARVADQPTSRDPAQKNRCRRWGAFQINLDSKKLYHEGCYPEPQRRFTQLRDIFLYHLQSVSQ